MIVPTRGWPLHMSARYIVFMIGAFLASFGSTGSVISPADNKKASASYRLKQSRNPCVCATFQVYGER